MNLWILRRKFCMNLKPAMVLKDFDFDPKYYSNNSIKIIDEDPIPNIEEIQQRNVKLLNKLQIIADFKSNPLDLIDEDLRTIQKLTFENIINTDYELLKEVSSYNLKLKGKNFRSWIIMLLSRALYSNNPQSKFQPFESTIYYELSALFAAWIEICHNATLLQDDIIDKAETRRSEKTAYKIYGMSNAVFASNFLISRASRMLSTLEKPYLSQIFSTLVYNLVYGELIQAKNFEEDESLYESIANYISKTYYKTASLMSLACRGVAIIHEFDESKQRKVFDFGAHFGIAFQVADDILDFTQSSEDLGKPAFNDLKSGLVTAPTIFALAESKSEHLGEMIKRKFSQENDIIDTLNIIDQTSGLDNSERLALMHVDDSISALASLDEVDPYSESYKALSKLTLKVKTRKY